MATKTVKRTWSIQGLSGFKDKTNFRYYAFLSTISIAFFLWMFRSIFIRSIYCNPENNSVNAPPGECYWYLQPGSRYYWGIQLHLSTCLPALVLATIQFTPRIRQNYPSYHRWAGRLTMVLGLVATFSAFLFVDVAMGGLWSLFSLVWTLGPLCIFSQCKAWMAIRSGNIHVHRRWMLRTWGWLGCIVTARPLIFLGTLLLTRLRSAFPLAMELSCAKLLFMTIVDESRSSSGLLNIFTEYPHECLRPEFLSNNLTQLQDLIQTALVTKTRLVPQLALEALKPGASVSVPASLASQRVDQGISALSISFRWATWTALIIHFVLVELYLSRTKKEDDRLREVSDLRRRGGNTKKEKKENEGYSSSKEKKTL